MSDITQLDVTTGEESSRNYTKKERDSIAALTIDGQDQINAIVAEEEQKKILKQEALSILQGLGLSEDQAKAIAGL